MIPPEKEVSAVIPIMILFGLAFGRWWKSAIISGAVLWPVILIFAGMARHADIVDGTVMLSAAVLGAANTAAGVAVHQAILWLVRLIRRNRAAKGSRLHQP